MVSVQDSVIHVHGMLRYFRNAYKEWKSSKIPNAWMMLSCTEDHLVVTL
jgi:hypothetical protein